MKLRSKATLWALAWVISVAAGVIAGRQSIDAPLAEHDDRHADRPGGRGAGAGLSSAPNRSGTLTRSGRSRSRQRSPEELRQALQLTLIDADEVRRSRELLRLVDSLRADEFQGVVEAFRTQGLAEARRSDYALLLHAWVDADPLGAVTYLEESEPSGNARRNALTAWAAADPFAAAAWVEGRADGGGTNDWTVGLLQGIASNDPDLARQRLEDLPAGKTRSVAMEAILPYVVQQGFDFTADWVVSIADEDLQRGTARRAARNLTRLNPKQAGDWITNIDNRTSRRAASEEVSNEWARRDLEAARRWTENLPEDTRTEAAEGVARQMAVQDPERTADWLDSLGDNPDLDGARRIFLQVSAQQDPQLALDNVYTLSQETERVRTYNRILSQWSREDGQAVREWVLANPSQLPDNVQRRYLKPRK